MAGFYPDVPATRLAYDRDGTVLMGVSNTGVVSDQSGRLVVTNDESRVAAVAASWEVAI